MASTSQSEKETRSWLELPPDLTSFILSKLGAVEILTSAQNVCTTWRNICKDRSMWRRIDMRNHGGHWEDYQLEVMCCLAVDRSCGDLVYINLEEFGTDDLLQHIADRSSSLRHIRLVSCYEISDEGLIDAIPKLSMLEEVEIFNIKLSGEALEAIGCSCPILKTFKYNQRGDRFPHYKCDKEALAIATTMHELRHLHLFGNKLTDASLPAILKGCPHLEYLDLRWCFNVTLKGDVGKHCIDRIKCLRRPYQPTDDYEFQTLRHYNCGFSLRCSVIIVRVNNIRPPPRLVIALQMKAFIESYYHFWNQVFHRGMIDEDIITHFQTLLLIGRGILERSRRLRAFRALHGET